MQNADKGTAAKLDGQQLRIGIVQARFNAEVTNKLAQTCRAELLALGVSESTSAMSSCPARSRCRWRSA